MSGGPRTENPSRRGEERVMRRDRAYRSSSVLGMTRTQVLTVARLHTVA
jgi:hypothetical protein